MKKLYFLKAAFILFMCISSYIIKAQNINAIDIDKYKNSWPRNNEYNAKNIYAYLNGHSYFTADDGVHGRELWKTDGTSAGTKLVKDVNPGTAPSDYDYSQYDLTASGGKLFFTADGGPGKRGLWESDGTSAGTHFIIDVSNGANDAANGTLYLPSYLTDVNGTMFFAVSYYDYINTFTYVNQVWKTDGTTAGTALVADLGANGYNLQQLKNVNGKLFFTFYDFNSYTTDLYVSDGTPAGTTMVGGYYLNSLVNALQLTSSNGLLYFIGDDGSGTGTKLFQSDGTVAGTYAFKNNGITCYATSNPYDVDTFAIINNVLYFQGSDATGDNTLYKYDEANPAAGVTLVKDIIPGISSYPSFMTNVNGTLFFTIGPAGADAELWKSDGTDAGTVLVKDINPGGYNGYYGLTAVNDILMFAFNDNAHGSEVWKSDGTAAGTKIVKDINPGVYSSVPQYLTYTNGLLLFGAFDGVNGYELWKSNGTTGGTSMVKDINKASTSSSNPFGFTAIANNKTVFAASDEEYGNELWITDGTAAGTKLVKDIYHGSGDSYPAYFTKLKNKVYFFAADSTGYHLYKTNGTAKGTQSIPTSIDNETGYVASVISGNDLMYIFVFSYDTYDYELWRSDGTTEGTYAVASNLNISDYAIVDNTLFFSNYDYGVQYGSELWKSEGTPATTGIVKDIIPGSSGSDPFSLINYNGKLYFGAYNSDGSYSQVLWTSDGTDAGTKIVKPLYVQQTYPSFAQANGKFFFYGENAVTKGFELYASDGTAAGTKLVKDIYKGDNSSNVSSLISGDTLVYFTANDGRHGQELWRSDGTANGTFMLKNITPGGGYTYPSETVNINDRLYFTLNDTLWMSDGTKKGTKPINDVALEGVADIYDLTNVNGVLYFSGYTFTAGQELYVLDPGNKEAPVALVNNSEAKTDNDAFAARLLTNPIIDDLKFTVNVKTQQQASITITDMSGRTLIADKRMLSSGTSILSYSTSNWTQGIYIINIATSEKFNATLKALK